MGQDITLRPNGISVIICCYNSAKNISNVLRHIELQNCIAFPLEVVVVNNNSKDDTDSVVTSFINQSDLKIRLVFEPKPGLMYARELGLKESKYQFIQFCDDDNLLSANYIETVFRNLYNDNTVGACGGMGVSLIDKKDEPYWFLKYSRAYAVGSQVKKSQDHLYGAGMAIRYSALEAIYNNGFKSFLSGRKGNVLLAGDDGELVLALILKGYKLMASDEIYFQHIIPKERLNIKYLTKLHEGFGMMYPVIDMYRDIIKTKKVKSVFFYDLLFLTITLKSMGAILLKKGIERSVQLSIVKGRIKGIFYFINKKSQVLEVIKKIKK